MTWVRTRRHATRCLGMMFVALSVGVAFTPTAQQDFSKVEIETIPLVLGFAMLVGAGGNIGVSTVHTGGNENMGKAGVLIMVHEHVRARLTSDPFIATRNQALPAAAKKAWPVVTFEDGLTPHLNGQTIEISHVEAAHTVGIRCKSFDAEWGGRFSTPGRLAGAVFDRLDQ